MTHWYTVKKDSYSPLATLARDSFQDLFKKNELFRS